MCSISIIVAMDQNRAIGKDGDLYWRNKLKRDMDHFQQATSNRVVLAGRKTYESIPEKYRPLSNRENVILTRNTDYFQLGCNIIYSLEEVFRLYYGREVFVIGGAEIYELFLPHSDKIIVTHVDTVIPEADAFFPEVKGCWKPRQLFSQKIDEKNQFAFSVTEYFRTTPM